MTERMGIERLTGLVAFAKAGSLGSFAAAARALSVTPSAVSKSIGRLEEQLGLTLFNRTTRSLSLTVDGSAIHAAAMRLLTEAENIEQLASVARSEPSGVLKIATSNPIGVHVVAPLLERFFREHPGVQVDIRVDDRFADMVGEGIDLAIRIGQLPDSNMKARSLPSYRLCCHASPAYLEEHGTPTHPDDLGTHRLLNLRYQNTGLLFQWPFDCEGERREFVPDALLIADASEALIGAALGGVGIAMCADFMVSRHVERGDLLPILTEYSVERQNIAAVWPETRNSNPNVRAFIDLLKSSHET